MTSDRATTTTAVAATGAKHGSTVGSRLIELVAIGPHTPDRCCSHICLSVSMVARTILAGRRVTLTNPLTLFIEPSPRGCVCATITVALRASRGGEVVAGRSRLVVSLAAALGLCGARAGRAQTPPMTVVLNEIAWMGTTTDANDEWMELYNPTGAPINLTGWTLVAADGTPNVALSGTIPAHGYFLLERTDDNSVPGVAADQIYTGALGNAREVLSLRDATATPQDSVDACSAGNNTTKATMQRVGPVVAGTAASNWTNGPVGGTPANSGATSSCAPPQHVTDCRVGPPFAFRTGGPMVINEVMINPSAVTDANGEYVELYNAGTSAVDLAGWTIKDDGGNSFTIPAGSPALVAPGAVFVLAAQANPALNGGFTPNVTWSNFFLSNSGDEVVLLDPQNVEQDRLNYDAPPFTDSVGESVER